MGRRSTVVAFLLHTKPPRIRIWLLEKLNQDKKLALTKNVPSSICLVLAHLEKQKK